MYNPQSTSSGSIMPSYQWIIESELDKSLTEKKMRAMVQLGVPYSLEEVENAQQHMTEQGTEIVENLYTDPDFVKSYEASKERAAANGEEFVEMKDREIVALIAYLQRLGTDIKVDDSEDNASN